MPASTIRAKARAEMIGEIKEIARRHLAAEGANLSLRAVARDMGMVSSAIYRYFPSRDELLTALILDAYHALGDAAEEADAAMSDRADLRGRWLAACQGIRRWALTHPAEYALLFGTPVPGYAAPPETIQSAGRTPAVLIGVVADGFASGAVADPGAGDSPGAVLADFTRVREALTTGLPEELLIRASVGWIHCFGAISFELFGQLDGAVTARDEYFDHQMGAMADLIGLR